MLVSDVGASLAATAPAEAWHRRGGAGKDRVGRSFTGRVSEVGSWGRVYIDWELMQVKKMDAVTGVALTRRDRQKARPAQNKQGFTVGLLARSSQRDKLTQNATVTHELR